VDAVFASRILCVLLCALAPLREIFSALATKWIPPLE
jgi:hypothetical protein